jgi:16S rRNA (cytidine1402-2'-O)-methyltransferase
VADPGASLVAAAHALGIRVRPLVGPSALLLAVMASGLNGQSFRFCGYLPVDAHERARRLQALERDSRAGETQAFIETPYRSGAMFDAILAACAPATRVAIAVDLTGSAEYVQSRTVGDWQRAPRPPLERRPAMFLLLA